MPQFGGGNIAIDFGVHHRRGAIHLTMKAAEVALAIGLEIHADRKSARAAKS
jgi:hypothetical protein